MTTPTFSSSSKGYASYDVMGGRYVFTRSFVTSNSYDGIPDPTAADVRAYIGKFGVERFMGNYDFNHVVGKVESIILAKEPKFVWHTPNGFLQRRRRFHQKDKQHRRKRANCLDV